MRARGLESPDLADAFCMAFSVRQAISYSWLPYDDSSFREIAAKHGWDWTSSVPDNDESYLDRRTWNRSAPLDEPTGFGGVRFLLGDAPWRHWDGGRSPRPGLLEENGSGQIRYRGVVH